MQLLGDPSEQADRTSFVTLWMEALTTRAIRRPYWLAWGLSHHANQSSGHEKPVGDTSARRDDHRLRGTNLRWNPHPISTGVDNAMKTVAAKNHAQSPRMPVARAFAHNDVALIVWDFPAMIQNCLGFAVIRIDDRGNETELPAWVGFAGQTNANWQARTTRDWPVQKFSWKDLTGEPGGTYTYRIIPRVGTPGKLRDAPATLQCTSGPVTLTPERGRGFRAYFNRGILSSQFLTRQIPAGKDGRPDFRVLQGRIDQPGDPLRQTLMGQVLDGFRWFFSRPDANGPLHAALYELNDPELLQLLFMNKDRMNLILSNTGADDATNAASRQSLKEVGLCKLVDRMLASGHIGHNKFVVCSDKNDKGVAVLSGSMNWTDTALCAQSNNMLIIDSPAIAAGYLEYWNRLEADEAAQDTPLRDADRTSPIDAQVGDASVRIWFSPNTRQHTKPARNPPQPVDLGEVFDLMRAAKKAVLFLEFQPGSPSVLDVALEVANDAGAGVFVRGAVTDPKAVQNFDTELVHRPGQTGDVAVAAAAISDQFGYWQAELLKSSPGAHAIIHDKIVVIDPTEPDCVVITGSHNQGYRASYNNDENLIIVRGNQALAQAYAVHVLDVYDHYRFRFQTQQKGAAAYDGLSATDTWQSKYFDKNDAASRDNDWWR